MLLYNNRLHVPNSVDLRHLIMDEFHKRPYVGHPGYHKMVTIVIQVYYWPRMQQDITHYTVKFLECQQVKVEHQHPVGILQPIQISEWKWEVISMDFITGLPNTIKQHDAIMVTVYKC
jgi:hypothetical protein